jgi:diguanylate cyclase (GGDEF)-like protein
MDDPQFVNPFVLPNSALQLHFEALSAEMVRIRCEVLLQHNIWHQQQQQLQQDKALLSVALLQTSALHASTQDKLQRLEEHGERDVLTQTLNRDIMLDRISHAISLAKREQSQFALLFIDLDNFKPINDQFGHAAGDAVLQQVSARLTSAIRDSDALSRHGGDEFLLLLNNTKSPQDISAFTAKIVHMLAEPYQLACTTVSSSASVGVAVFPADGDNAAALINVADAAMYRAKQQGGNRAC